MKEENPHPKEEIKHDIPAASTDYVITEGQGFWHRMDRRVEKFGESLQKASNSKWFAPFKKVGSAISAAWNSKPMTPVRAVAQGINKVLKHPTVQFASFVAGITLASLAVAAAAPVALPLAAATLGVIAGGKIVSTAYQARKTYRMEQLEKQVHLLEVLKKNQIERQSHLSQIPSETKRQTIEFALTKKQSDQELHTKELRSKTKDLATSIGANLLSVASTAMDFTQLPRSLHSAQNVLSSIGTGNDVHGTILQPESQKDVVKGTEYENKLRSKINQLSAELQVPKANTTAELQQHVANVVADNLALKNIAPNRDSHSLEGFVKTRETIVTKGEHLQDLPHQENRAKSAALHVGKAFFGIEDHEPNASSQKPSPTPPNKTKAQKPNQVGI